MEWKKISSNYISSKTLISKIYKQLLHLNSKTKQKKKQNKKTKKKNKTKKQKKKQKQKQKQIT